MPNSLVIVESPAKARTLKKFLGKHFHIKASVGHVRDLPQKKLGVDVEKDFEPQYEVISGKRKALEDLKKAAAKTKTIYLAPDPDREGEAIAWHIQQELGPVTSAHIYRINFNEITKQAVTHAVENPGEIDPNKVNAQQARRILDRLVGYKLSPLLGQRLKNWGLSAGRVQSVALRIVCDREREIEAFKPEEYWSLTATLLGREEPSFEAKLVALDGKKPKIRNQAENDALLKELSGAQFQVAKVEKKERKRKPLPPFITSTLQQDAFRRLRFSGKKTMRVAQQLYEGLELGELGAQGLITYMRTDSTRIASEALTEARDFIQDRFGKDYLPAKAQVYRGKKGAQDAHEAVRPTSVRREPDQVSQFLTKDQLVLYRLIWNRFIASQMNPARYDQTTIDAATGRFVFRATGSILKFPGFTRLYEEGEDGEKAPAILPTVQKEEPLSCQGLEGKQHFTQPPARYTEASLIKTLEQEGIGRPSTYAAILSTLSARDYVRTEKRQLIPTPVGLMISDLLTQHFPSLMDFGFTAEMESRLDRIEEGRDNWVETLKKFYGDFESDLERAKDTLTEPEVLKDRKCPDCGSNLAKRPGSYGMFIGCTGYPDCRYRESLEKREVAPPVETDIECDLCGAKMVEKDGRFGRFLSCSTYPKCKNAKPLPTGISCLSPGCDGELTRRRSKRGRFFYGCNRYPKCSFVAWSRPVPRPCPLCESPYLVQGQKGLRCPTKGCDHQEPLPEAAEEKGAAAVVEGGPPAK